MLSPRLVSILKRKHKNNQIGRFAAFLLFSFWFGFMALDFDTVASEEKIMMGVGLILILALLAMLLKRPMHKHLSDSYFDLNKILVTETSSHYLIQFFFTGKPIREVVIYNEEDFKLVITELKQKLRNVELVLKDIDL